MDSQSDAQSMEGNRAVLAEAPTLTRLRTNPRGHVGEEARGLHLVSVLPSWTADSPRPYFAECEQLFRGQARWMLDGLHRFHGSSLGAAALAATTARER